MTDVWSERAEAYRESDAHRQGRDLELFAEWAEGETALDVATGGGNVARVLREAGLEVVTIDSAPGMQPDGRQPRGGDPVRRLELRRRRMSCGGASLR